MHAVLVAVNDPGISCTICFVALRITCMNYWYKIMHASYSAFVTTISTFKSVMLISCKCMKL